MCVAQTYMRECRRYEDLVGDQTGIVGSTPGTSLRLCKFNYMKIDGMTINGLNSQLSDNIAKDHVFNKRVGVDIAISTPTLQYTVTTNI